MSCTTGKCGSNNCITCNPLEDAAYKPSLCEKLISDVIRNLNTSNSSGSMRVRGIKVPVDSGLICADYNAATKPSPPNEFLTSDLIVVEYNGGVYIYTGLDKNNCSSADSFIFLNPAVTYNYEATQLADKIVINELVNGVDSFELLSATTTKAGLIKPAEFTKLISPWAIFGTSSAPVDLNSGGRWVGDLWVGNGNQLFVWSGTLWEPVSGGASGTNSGKPEISSTIFDSSSAIRVEPNGSYVYKVYIDDNFGTKPLLYTLYDDSKKVILPEEFAFGFTEQMPDPNNPAIILDKYYVEITLGPEMPQGVKYALVYGANIFNSTSGQGKTYVTADLKQIVTVDNTKDPGVIATNQTGLTYAITRADVSGPLFNSIVAGANITVTKTQTADLNNPGEFITVVTISSTGGGGSFGDLVDVTNNLDTWDNALLADVDDNDVATIKRIDETFTRASRDFEQGLVFNAGKVNLGGIISILSSTSFSAANAGISYTNGTNYFFRLNRDATSSTVAQLLLGKTGVAPNTYDTLVELAAQLKSANITILPPTSPAQPLGATPYGNKTGRIITNNRTNEVQFVDLTNTVVFDWQASGTPNSLDLVQSTAASGSIQPTYYDTNTQVTTVFAPQDIFVKSGISLVSIGSNLQATAITGQLSRAPIGIITFNIKFEVKRNTTSNANYVLFTIAQPFRPQYKIPVAVFTKVGSGSAEMLEGVINPDGTVVLVDPLGFTTSEAKCIINATYENAVKM